MYSGVNWGIIANVTFVMVKNISMGKPLSNAVGNLSFHYYRTWDRQLKLCWWLLNIQLSKDII